MSVIRRLPELHVQQLGFVCRLMKFKAFINRISKYVIGYLWGVLGALIFTDASLFLGGVFLLPIYVIAAVPGFIVWLVFMSTASEVLTYLYSAIALLPLYGEWRLRRAANNKAQFNRIRALRPLWYTFPVGFLGTLAIYGAAIESI